MTFSKPKLQVAKIKIALMGPSWSGKTYSSLKLARGLVGATGKIALIDTENNASAYYHDLTEFDSLQISGSYKYKDFVDAIDAAITGNYDCLIIDSASHIWEGTLAFKEKLDSSDSGSRNSFANWQTAGSRYNEIINRLLAAPLHVIACMRVKTDYVLETIDGKSRPRKVGLAPIMRDGSEYEFSICYLLGQDNLATVTKDRTKTQSQEPFLITEDTGRSIADWITGKRSADPDGPDCEAWRYIAKIKQRYNDESPGKGDRFVEFVKNKFGNDFANYKNVELVYLQKLLKG